MNIISQISSGVIAVLTSCPIIYNTIYNLFRDCSKIKDLKIFSFKLEIRQALNLANQIFYLPIYIEMTTFNPFTGKKITIGGTAHRLVEKIKAEGGTPEQQKLKYHTASRTTTKSKYAGIPQEQFCGSEGGYPPSSRKFPVTSA